MKILADSHIPYIKGVLDNYVDITYTPAEKIDNSAVAEADILLIRTPTKCTPKLLENSRCRLIVTASIGFDHIDREYCKHNNIEWQNSPGCNATSVAQYVLASILLKFKDNPTEIKDKTIGIVGVGHIGKAVMHNLKVLGAKILLNDPPRAEVEGDKEFVSLQQIAEECDIISFHTPLTTSGNHPTKHLANHNFFNATKRKPIIINTARGGVVDNNALYNAKLNGVISDIIIDCWEGEPNNIYQPIIEEAFIATPHIAGYSDDGKANGSRISINKIAEYLNITAPLKAITPTPIESNIIDLTDSTNPLLDAVVATYNPIADFESLKKDPSKFEKLRVDYPLRREYNAYYIKGAKMNNIEQLLYLGFNIL